jgi:hypothetical protein
MAAPKQNQFTKAIDMAPPVEQTEQNGAQPPGQFPVLSRDALPGLLGEAVDAACENSEAAPAAVAVTFLAHFSAAVGNLPHLRVGDTKHYARINAAVCGNTSRARKGTSSSPVERISKAAESTGKYPPLTVTPGPLSSGEGLIFAVRDASDELNKRGEIIDAGVSDKRLLVLEGELGGPLSSMTRDGNSLSAIIRTAWDSGNIAPLTKSNRIKATGAHICIVGHITKQELHSLLKGTDIWNGFANRFLWVCARRQKLVPAPEPMPDATVNRIAERLADTIANARQVGRVSLDPNARQAWPQIYPRLTRDEPGVFGVVTARAEAQVLRLALIYALLDSRATIRVEHLTAALAFWQYCLESARHLFGTAEKDPLANKVLQALSSGEKTHTDLNALFSGHLSKDKLQGVLAELQSSGRISQRKEGGGQGKGKPKTIWSVNETFELSEEDFAELED